MAKSRQQREERRKVSGKRRAEEHKGGFASTSINVTDSVTLFSVDNGKPKRLEIIPYEVKGDDNPYADKGDLHFERTYFTHRDVGPNGDTYVCPAKTAGKKCPICEHRAKLVKDPDADEDIIKEMGPKERQLWNVFDHDDPDAGVQVWDVSYHLFGKHLDKKIKDADEDEEYEFFADPEDGLTVKVGFEEKSFGSTKFYDANNIEFKKRSSSISDDILDQAQDLDGLLIIKPYDELKRVFLQMDDEPSKKEEEEEEVETPPKKLRGASRAKEQDKPPKEAPAKRAKAPTAKDKGLEQGEGVVHKEFGECTIFRISKDGLSLLLLDEDDETHKNVPVADVTPIDEVGPPDDDDTGEAVPAGDVQEGGDDWDDDWDD